MSHLRFFVLAAPLAAAALLSAPGLAEAGGSPWGSGAYRGGYGYRYGYGYGGSGGVGIYIGGPYRSYPYGYYGPGYPPYGPGYYAPGYLAPTVTTLRAAPAQRTPEPALAGERPPDTTVHVTVRVPMDAEVWFAGQKTRQTGTLRRFVSPPLTPGQEYTYEVRARWTVGGEEVVQARHIAVSAGTTKIVDFTKSDAELIAAPKPVQP